VRLDQVLTNRRATSGSDGDTINIVVLQADDRQFGLVVEGINDTEEIVVKPLGKQLKGISVFAGATIMGDGKVALILDVLGIAQRSSVVSEVRDRSLMDLSSHTQEKKNSMQTLLLLGMGKERRVAIPLSMVARLEEISVSSIERANNQEVVQYRGEILPLIRLSSVLHCEPSDIESAMLQMVVYTEKDRSFGLVVDKILDIVETSLEIKRSTTKCGVMGSIVIHQRVTDLLDVPGIIRAAKPEYSDELACA
jgi:two-component system chemotaxis sensor kinase CheA